jgi:putative transposase
VKGRKRHLLVDTTGLVVKALVHPAHVPDGAGGQRLLEGIVDRAHALPRLRQLWVDTAYQGGFKDGVEQTLGWTVAVVRRPRRWFWVPPGDAPPEVPRGFQVLPRRWVVERTQPQYLQSALDAQTGSSHDRTHWVAQPA